MDWVVTDNIYKEAWRRLLEYANVELTVEEIEKRHGKATSVSRTANYKKQAAQVRVSALQAKEYFEAAAHSSSFTSPNHLYYGMVALSSMMMLLLGDGTKSLDYLRQDKKNSHHGLIFSTGCTSHDCVMGLSLLANSHAEITPRGHFANWYSSLPMRGREFGVETRMLRGATRTQLVVTGGFDTPKLEDIVGRKRSALDLLKCLPDLRSDLARYGVHIPSSRSTHTINVAVDGTITRKWLIHGAGSREDLELLLARFTVAAGDEDVFETNFEDLGTGGVVTCTVKPDRKLRYLSWPGTRDTFDHKSISYAGKEEMHEIVDSYLVCYQLSMLSRYFPDLWMSCLESHGKASRVVESAVAVLLKKVPVLVLSMLSEGGILISTHREPWLST